MISIFNLTLGANESREVAITGEYFELRNALYPVALIELLDRSGGVVSRLENPEQSDFVRPGRYETVRVTNGATAQTIKHFYGTGDAGSRRTSGLVKIDGSSDVSVIDGEKNRTLAGGMFVGVPAAQAVAAQYGHTQLWNPVGSGKNLIVTQLSFSVGVATNVNLVFSQVQLLTSAAANLGNKKAGAAVGAAQLWTETKAAPIGGAIYGQQVAANDPFVWGIRGALVVPPGYGLTQYAGAVNAILQSVFEWFEEPA